MSDFLPSADAKRELEKALRHIGQPRSSTAFSSLCVVSLKEAKGCQPLKSPPSVAAHLSFCGTITTFDYYGRPKRDGGDPIMVTLGDNSNRSTMAISKTIL